ncbi:MAG: glycosyltransferase, partial [Planctomyces sp.]|nr:glycosyltransferase [Planctomyces sp.]
EIQACGIPLITNQIPDNGFEELFSLDQKIWTYDSPEELIDKVHFLVRNETESHRLASAARDHVLRLHTYKHRMMQLLSRSSPNRASAVVSQKSGNYYEFDRPDVRSLIPLSSTRILDIGCGGGRLGAAVKADRGCHVTGIESSVDAARRAAEVLDDVVNDSVEAVSDQHFRSGTFDCLVFADVLEHLRNPLAVLRKCIRWLSVDGTVVVSVPNSRNISVVSGLIDGNWTYERAGILDDDHVRCFTRRELEKLLFRAGLDVVQRIAIPGPGYREWDESGRPGVIHSGRLQLSGLSESDAEEFFTYQHIIKAHRVNSRDFGTTSIVIVTFNQLWFTQQCVDSLITRTDEDVELIFVDNGSTDGTPEYLSTIPNARVLLNRDNRGFAAAVNQGIEVCTGDQVLLLNNDCIVTTGWLSGLLEALYDNSQNGLVGPVSNCVSGEQQIAVSYEDLSSLDGFAWQCRQDRRLTLTDRLVGFCLLIRRSVIDQIGLFDERFEVGCFEDDDFCRRATGRGFNALIVHSVFVHHFGSVTFRGAGFDLSEVLARNQQLYLEKWDAEKHPQGAPDQREIIRDDEADAKRYRVVETPQGELLLKRAAVRVSLCMIVRNNEDTIEACLDSIYPWVDEIIVVDTGSTDQTPSVCRRFGVRLFEFPWCDDFAAARNESLKYATGDWIFWMDSDDVIPQDQGRRLLELVRSEHSPDCFGYVMQVHCTSATRGQLTIVDHVKLFRNRPELRFEHRIHEQILPSIRRAGGAVQFTDLYVIHSGSDPTPEVRRRKLERDFRILHLDLADRPDHPFVLFNLGMTYDDANQHAEAERYLRRCLEVSGNDESHVPKARSLLVNCLRMQGRLEDAIDETRTAINHYPEDRELLFRHGCLCLDDGRYEEAISAFEEVLKPSTVRTFTSIDPSIMGYKANHNLALAYQQVGRDQEAEAHWLRAVGENPHFGPGWLCLVRHRIARRQTELARGIITRMNEFIPQSAESAIAEALCLEADQEFHKVSRVLQPAFRATGDIACLDELARIQLENGFLNDGIQILEQMRAIQPDNPVVLHNLGTAFSLIGDSDNSRLQFERCLNLEPARMQTLERLTTLCEQSGDVESALQYVQAALKKMPHDGRLLDIWKHLQGRRSL